MILSTQVEHTSLLTGRHSSSLPCKWVKRSHSPFWLTGQSGWRPECVGSSCTCFVRSWINQCWCPMGEVSVSAFIIVTSPICLFFFFLTCICSLKKTTEKSGGGSIWPHQVQNGISVSLCFLSGRSFIFLLLFFSFIWFLHPKSQGKWGNNNFVALHLAHPEKSYF